MKPVTKDEVLDLMDALIKVYPVKLLLLLFNWDATSILLHYLEFGTCSLEFI